MKEYLSQRGVQYLERDIIADEEAMNELERMNLFITPVTVIEGQPVVGYNVKELDRLLAL